ncbi:MAG TPA: DUF2946 family protein [Bradyrhizobium sp.]|nr:DUF2946 family protein [Bradyrhizobium sp.]
MRRQLQKFLPIVLIALAVQILAPIASSWAAAIASSDPLQVAEICHSLPDGSGRTDQGSDPHAHDGACLICCAVQASAAVDTPEQATLPVPYRLTTPVVWHVAVRTVSPARHRSNTQARAPPLPL